MSQSHLVIDFPIRGPANAKALPEELPALIPDLAKAQDDLGTVHFSRFMVEGDEKLLFLSDIDGEVDQHIERLVESAGPVLDAIFEHVADPPATPVADNPERVGEWLRQSCPRASRYVLRLRGRFGSGHQGVCACGGLHGQYLAEPLADIHDLQVTSASLCSELVGPALVEKKGQEGMDTIGTLHVAHWVPFENDHIGFFTVYDGDMEKYIQDFAEKISVVFDSIFPHVEGAPPTPVAKNAQAFYQWALDNNYPPIGFYSAYPGLSVQDIRALLADRTSHPCTAG